MLLSKAEELHILAALEDYAYVVSIDPAIITNKEEDRLLVALEILRHEQDANTDT